MKSFKEMWESAIREDGGSAGGGAGGGGGAPAGAGPGAAGIGAPANSAGSGNIAGIGVGPHGEPGVYPRKKKLYK